MRFQDHHNVLYSFRLVLQKFQDLDPPLPGLSAHPPSEPPCGNLAEWTTEDKIDLYKCEEDEECIPQVCVVEPGTMEEVEFIFKEADINPTDGCVDAGEIIEILVSIK